MKIQDYDYPLPQELIARLPADKRENSRLIVTSRKSDTISHHFFRELPDLLRPDDLLVMNDTRVFPARLLGRKAPDGGAVEALLVRRQSADAWWALVRPGKRIKKGQRVIFEKNRLEAVVEDYGEPSSGERLLKFRWQGDWWETIEAVGHVPLPPYILKARKHDAQAFGNSPASTTPDNKPNLPTPATSQPVEIPEDKERYQTIYAGDERASVAAPTAGLHFSPSVFEALDRRGIERVFLQLHVGPGTFQPIKTERVEDHKMHEEFIRVPPGAARAVDRARRGGRRIVAVGTTVVRALETAALAGTAEGEEIFRPDAGPADGESEKKDASAATAMLAGSGGPFALHTASKTDETGQESAVAPLSGWTRLLIAPGFRFRAVDALLTNFHLPRSSLLLLVSALAGRERIMRVYKEAVERKYRFYSYGDCMLIE